MRLQMQREGSRVEVTRLYRECQKAKEQTVVQVGGAGSSKSYSLCQFFIFERLLKLKNYRLLMLRQTRHSNKLSTYKSFIDILEKHKIYNQDNHNRTDLIYTVPENNSYVLFAGLEQRERIKSTEWHDIWCEEASEFDKETYPFLKIRLYRGQKEKQFRPRLWLSFNPLDCWIFDLEGKADVRFVYSNYKDNPFVNEEYIKTLENLKDEDEAYYKIYALGQRAKPKNLIYKPYMVEKFYPPTVDNTIYGLDFGFNNPSGLLQADEKDMEFYLTELLYQTHLTNSDLIEKLKELIPEGKRDSKIYADSSEPQRIQEIVNAGFNIVPSDKNVKDGIDFCKRQKFHTLESNVNLNKERVGYKYREDRNGNIFDEPVKFRDHLMDAKRYAVYTHYRNASSVDIASIKRTLQEIPDMATAKQDW